MNFIKFLLKSLVFFSFCIAFQPVASSTPISSSGLPRVPDSYYFRLPQSIQNEVILDLSIGKNGNVIILTDSRICINNGENWDFLSRNGIIGICGNPDEPTWFFSEEGFFKLEVDSGLNYVLEPVSLKHSFIGEPISQAERAGDRFLVSTGDNLFLLNETEFKDIARGKDSIEIFPVRNGFFIVHTTGSGFLNLEGKYLELPGILSRGDKVADHPSGYLIYQKDENRYITLNSDFTLSEEDHSFPLDIADMLYLDEGFFVFLLRELDIEIYDTRGSQVFKLENDYPGQPGMLNRIMDIPGSVFWIVDDRSIRVFRFPDRIYRAALGEGFEQVNDVHRYRESVYLAGNQGIISFPGRESIIKDTRVFKLSRFNDGILFLSDNGLYRYHQGEASLWVEGLFSDFICDTASSTVILKGENNLYLLDAGDPSSLRASKLIRDFNYLEYLVTDSKLFYVTPRGFKIVNLRQGQSEEILFPSYIKPLRIMNTLAVGSRILLFTSKDVWIFDVETKTFLKDNKLRLPCRIREIAKLSHDRLIIREHRSDAEGYYRILDTGLNEVFRFRLPDYIGDNIPPRIFSVGGDELLVSGYRGNWIYNPGVEESRQHPLILHELVFGEDTVIFRANYTDLSPLVANRLDQLSPANNTLFARFSLPAYTDPVFEYQIRRPGKSNPEWSHWFHGNYLYSEELHYGEHILQIRAKSREGNPSRILELRFRIKHPFYLKWWAIALYALIGLVLLFYFYKLYSLRILNAGPDPSGRAGEGRKPEIRPAPVRREPSPEPIPSDASALKRSKWEKFEMATVLFSDIQGFTKIAEQMNPEVLIDELDRFFFHFDSVVGKHNIEKIKTIGDAYMAAGGIPVKNSTNPIQVILAALEVQQYMKMLKKSNAEIWELRIGIHTGPVIAGIVGQKKRSYDIWGDTVNTASRMESSGKGGKINISGVTYNLVKDYFLCQYRGKLPVKYKGNIDMYFVKGLRPELSINLAGLPNRKFYLKLQLLRLQDLEDHVFEKLDEELSSRMYFHTAEYARHLYEHSHLLAKAENLDMEETLMIRTASLLLHLGYISNYNHPETESAALARSILPEFQYSSKQINTISNLILATKWPPEPKTLLEKIMVDVRMEYLGRADFTQIFRLLFLEVNELSGPVEFRVWKENMIKLLESFSYYTYAGRRLREVSFEDQVRKLESLQL